MDLLHRPLPLPARQHRVPTVAIALTTVVALSCNPLSMGHHEDEHDGSATSERNAALLEEVRKVVAERYVDSVVFDPARDTTVWTFISRLDPYSFYEPPPAKTRFEANMQNIGDLRFGITVQVIDDTPRFTFIEPASMFREVGVTIGDRLLAVKGISLLHMEKVRVDSILRALPDEPTVFDILRPNAVSDRCFVLNRVALPADDHFGATMIGDSAIYIAFDGFWAGVSDQVERTIGYLTQSHPQAKMVILDLRDNHGGLMDEAVNLVNLFCRSAMPVVQVRDREGELTNVAAGTTAPKFPNIAVSILVGGSSYSAAELFAGCMQDLDRATIIGQQTGGKGLVMNQIDLSNGDGLLLATGRYYLPSGRYIQVPYRDGIQNEGRPEIEHVEVNYLHTCERPERCEAAVYFTRSERMVYSGMGIIPDVFVPDHTNVRASAGLSPAILWKLWLDLVDHFQPQLARSQSYDAFCELVPVATIADYLRPRVVEFRHGGSVGAQELELLAAKLSAYTQVCAFGRYTHTARTLAFDRSVRVAMQLEAPVATTRLAEVQAAVTLHKHAGK